MKPIKGNDRSALLLRCMDSTHKLFLKETRFVTPLLLNLATTGRLTYGFFTFWSLSLEINPLALLKASNRHDYFAKPVALPIY